MISIVCGIWPGAQVPFDAYASQVLLQCILDHRVREPRYGSRLNGVDPLLERGRHLDPERDPESVMTLARH